jgi:hypothetical protein
MDFLEKNLEQIIVETPNEKLRERGLEIYGRKFSQVHLGNYGRLDVVTIEREYDEYFMEKERIIPILKVTIFELKKKVIDGSTFFQALEYAKGVSRYFELKGKFKYTTINFKIVLIGSEINTNGGFCFLPEFFNTVELVTYSYDFDGIKFTNISDYIKTNEGF